VTAALSPAAAADLVTRQLTRCNYCHDPIVWGTTSTDSRMPLDAEPVDDGNVLLLADGPVLRATVLGRAGQRQAFREQGHGLRLHHRLSCPQEKQWTTAARNVRPAHRRRGR
jgi:hypothetical protein